MAKGAILTVQREAPAVFLAFDVTCHPVRPFRAHFNMSACPRRISDCDGIGFYAAPSYQVFSYHVTPCNGGSSMSRCRRGLTKGRPPHVTARRHLPQNEIRRLAKVCSKDWVRDTSDPWQTNIASPELPAPCIGWTVQLAAPVKHGGVLRALSSGLILLLDFALA